MQSIRTHPIETTPIGLVGIDIAATTGPDLVGPRRAAEPPVLPIRLPVCSKCRHRKTLTIFLFDESGSVQSRTDPARPIANRRAETAVVLDHLGTCRCGNELVAFIYFDTGSYDLASTPLTKAGTGVIRAALADPAPATSSNMASALSKATTVAAQHPDHHVAIVTYSDFELFDPDPAGVLREFAGIDGSPHAVVLHSPVPDSLEVDDRVTVSHIGWDSVRGAVAHALLPTLGRHRTIGDSQ